MLRIPTTYNGFILRSKNVFFRAIVNKNIPRNTLSNIIWNVGSLHTWKNDDVAFMCCINFLYIEHMWMQITTQYFEYLGRYKSQDSQRKINEVFIGNRSYVLYRIFHRIKDTIQSTSLVKGVTGPFCFPKKR